MTEQTPTGTITAPKEWTDSGINPNVAQTAFQYAFGLIQAQNFANNIAKGFHSSPVTIGPSTIEKKQAKLMMICGEATEVSDALRVGNPVSEKIPGFTSEEEELADIVLRVMDYAAKEGCNVAEAIEAKLKYNTTRPYRHGGKLA